MRTAFMDQLILEARKNAKVFLVVGDLGYSVVEPFAAEFPSRFLNAGVAEQNMTGVAAGLASEGYHVFTYSIANFPTLRCLEQIRNDVCYHGLAVTAVAVGAGVSYGNLGYSHHGVQDLAIMRSLGEIVVLSPADPGEARAATAWLSANPGPSYLRLGKAGEAELHPAQATVRSPICLRESSGPTALVATGSILKIALQSADLAASAGHSIAVYSMPWIHPLNPTDLGSLARFKRILAIEEHVAMGGLAAALRENLPSSVTVESAAWPQGMANKVGSQDYLREAAGLSASALLGRVLGP
jgi:transketolase